MHISDLHFGRIHQPALNAIQAFLSARKGEIDLIAMTGDWTQRARLSQFRAARDFIRRLELPLLSVPGNHDVPLYNLLIRFTCPFCRYEKYVAAHATDRFSNSRIAIAGISSVNTLTPVAGRAHRRELRSACEYLNDKEAVRVLALHHPLPIHELALVPADIILSGHAHNSKVEWLERPDGRRVLHISAGTSSSTRTRAEVNSFHVIEADQRQIGVETYTLGDDGFVRVENPERKFDLPPRT